MVQLVHSLQEPRFMLGRSRECLLPSMKWGFYYLTKTKMSKTNKKMIPVVVYARTATVTQTDDNSIKNQLASIGHYAKANGYLITKEYLDSGSSGVTFKRSQLNKLRKDAKKKLWDTILISNLDRLSRSIDHLNILVKEFNNQGIKVLCVEGISTNL